MKPQSALARQQSAGLYLRLSEKDKGESESESIDNQRKLLVTEAKKRGFCVVDCYIDDGFTGTNFNRPSFTRMIHDINKGRINIVMTKDLSRFGRNYAQAGYYQDEFFPEHGVRYIAVLDGYDSELEYSTASAPWMNVANEQYARDISKKIKGAFKAKMQDGQFIGAFAPYGYRKHPDDKNRLIVDERSAQVVKRIFRMILEERKPSEIAAQLNRDHIPTPAQYRCQTHPGLDIARYSQRQEWTASIVSKIVQNSEYTGVVVHNRQRKASFKSNTYKQNPRDVWIINKGAHEAIVAQELFDAAQRVRKGRLRRGNTGFRNIFSGIAFCADCGKAMSAAPTRKWQEGKYVLSCGGYKLYGSKACSNHFIDFEHLSALIYREITACVAQMTQFDWDSAAQAFAAARGVPSQSAAAKINDLTKQIEGMDGIIQQLYEDRMRKVISEDRFQKMLAVYESRQEQLAKQQKELEASPSPDRALRATDVRAFAELAKKSLIPQQLTRGMLLAFVDKIIVHQGGYEGEKGSAVKRQKVRVYLKFTEVQRPDS